MSKFSVLFICILFPLIPFAQSKKEQIRKLTHKFDSMTGVISVKDKEISMLKKELDQCYILHSEDMNHLNQKFPLLEADLNV